jgi:hypothetical protein
VTARPIPSAARPRRGNLLPSAKHVDEHVPSGDRSTAASRSPPASSPSGTARGKQRRRDPRRARTAPSAASCPQREHVTTGERIHRREKVAGREQLPSAVRGEQGIPCSVCCEEDGGEEARKERRI